MRKISVGVLSVAGLLAVVLAIAGGPAAAQTAEVVTFTTDTIPGTYTVSWETQGGCDPTMRDAGSTTSTTDGATGSVSRTVAVPAGTSPSATVGAATPINGEEAEFAVVTASHCNYVWTVSFTSGLPGDEGVRCIANGTPIDPTTAGGPSRGGALSLASTANGVTLDGTALGAFTFAIGGRADSSTAVADGNCNTVAQIRVAIGPSTVETGLGADGTSGTYTSDGRYVPSDPTVGAVLHSTFTVTATPVASPKQNAECETVTGETEVKTQGTSTQNDDKVEVTLAVVETPLVQTGQACVYDVAVELPEGFEAASSKRTSVSGLRNFALTPSVRVRDGQSPSAAPPDPLLATNTEYVATSLADCDKEVDYWDAGASAVAKTTVDGPSCVTGTDALMVAVANRSVYITQNVVGDSGGANARYTLTEDKACGIPDDLPANLVGTGGISTTPSVTVVELREGFFNISTAVMDPTGEDAAGRFRAQRLALNNEADSCVVAAAVSHLPGNCSAAVAEQSSDLTTGVDAKGRAIMRFDITCSADTADDDMSGGDMDMGGDSDMSDSDSDMSGDSDMSDSDSDMSDSDMMGPPEDTPTG